MTKFQAILFDLDGTLLDSNMENFLPHYFSRLARGWRISRPPKRSSLTSWRRPSSCWRMTAARPTRGFSQRRFTRLPATPAPSWSRFFDDFYGRDLPGLQEYTQRKPEARTVVQLAFALGYKVAIATNPLFPATANRQRMAWAGVDDFPYDWVTTYENSRCCKPNLCYFDADRRTPGRPGGSLSGGRRRGHGHGRRPRRVRHLPRAGRCHPLSPDTPKPTYRGSLADLANLFETS